MSGPSEKAVQATTDRYSERTGVFDTPRKHVKVLLAAAHDPALGLDRSVCLRDVVEAVRSRGGLWSKAYGDFIEREFGGGS